MKTRNGFVSNSSSSSFVVNKRYVSDHQLQLINTHIEEGKKVGVGDGDYFDSWCVDNRDDSIKLSTTMDNFNMREFLLRIGVPAVAIVDGYYYNDDEESDDEDS